MLPCLHDCSCCAASWEPAATFQTSREQLGQRSHGSAHINTVNTPLHSLPTLTFRAIRRQLRQGPSRCTHVDAEALVDRLGSCAAVCALGEAVPADSRVFMGARSATAMPRYAPWEKQYLQAAKGAGELGDVTDGCAPQER